MSKNTSAIGKHVTIGLVALTYVALLCGGTALTAVNSAPTQQQPKEPEWSLQPAPDGYVGTYNAAGETVSMKARRLTAKSALNTLRRANGHTLVEVLRNGDTKVVEFRLPGVKLTLDLANRTFVGLSDKDRERLQDFLSSSDATLARKSIWKLIQLHRQAKEPKFIPVSFMMAGMLLGDEPPPVAAPQPGAEALGRLMTARAAYRWQSKTSKTESLVLAAYNKPAPQSDRCPFGPNQGCFGDSDCNGCCGPGCSGCTGYYTNDCLAHDNCVGSYGQAGCLGLLPAAVASLADAINKGYGDWPPGGGDDEYMWEELMY